MNTTDQDELDRSTEEDDADAAEAMAPLPPPPGQAMLAWFSRHRLRLLTGVFLTGPILVGAASYLFWQLTDREMQWPSARDVTYILLLGLVMLPVLATTWIDRTRLVAGMYPAFSTALAVGVLAGLAATALLCGLYILADPNGFRLDADVGRLILHLTAGACILQLAHWWRSRTDSTFRRCALGAYAFGVANTALLILPNANHLFHGEAPAVFYGILVGGVFWAIPALGWILWAAWLDPGRTPARWCRLCGIDPDPDA